MDKNRQAVLRKFVRNCDTSRMALSAVSRARWLFFRPKCPRDTSHASPSAVSRSSHILCLNHGQPHQFPIIKTNTFRFYVIICLSIYLFVYLQPKTNTMADNTATLEQVAAFLKEFQVKAKVFGIDYNIDKEENQQTLFDLEIPASKRDEYILSLKPEDYYQGPGVNDYDPEEGDVWMFGIGIKKIGRGKKIPIYIKIYITKVNGAANYCISFHIAKFNMTFPYKASL